MTITNKVSLKSVNGGNTPIADVPDGATVGAVTSAFDGTATVEATAAATGGTPTTFVITPTPTTSPATFTGASPVTVSGLSDATSYTFTAAGVNSTATGPAGAASASTAIVTAGSYFSIATTTSSTASSITFSSIPSTYTHLQIRYMAKTSWAQTTIADGITIRINGDTGSNYRIHNLWGQGSGVSAGTAAATYMGDNFLMSASNGATSTYGTGVVDILDYTNTIKNKTVRAFTGVETNNIYNGNFWGVGLVSGLWLSTAAITSITLLSGSGAGFTSASHFALYGVMA